MIEIKGLRKSFGKLQALGAIDLSIKGGSITAILGPNASGKTTLLKSILGLAIPDAGEINVDGVSDNYNYRSKIGYLPQIARFPENLRGNELIALLKDVRGSSSQMEGALIEKFGLQPSLEKPLRTLSGGTRQKISILLAFLFDAPVLILDEPANGLDPVSLIRLKELIAAEKAKGKTILLTTHSMGLVEELADEIVFLLEGKIHFKGSLELLKQTYREEHAEYAIAKMMDAVNQQHSAYE